MKSGQIYKSDQCTTIFYFRENNIYYKTKGKVSDINLVENKEAKLLSISHLIDD